MKMGNVSKSIALGLAICLSAGTFNSIGATAMTNNIVGRTTKAHTITLKSAYTDDHVSKTLIKRSEEGKRTFS